MNSPRFAYDNKDNISMYLSVGLSAILKQENKMRYLIKKDI